MLACATFANRRSRLPHMLSALVLLLAACTSLPPGTGPAQTFAPSASPTVDRWSELFQHTPYPYSTPYPSPETSVLDGTYIKLDPQKATPVPCRRCPDYLVEGGIWKLNFDKGIFRIFFQVTGWRSMGSFTASGDRLYLFNDPNCIEDVGVFRWSLEDGQLILQEVDDPCAIDLRGKNLSKQPWLSCQPPSEEAASSGPWTEPAGCD